jgi:putative FmdB family regulatory protein
MPVYDYLCPSCGPFADMRPMAECELPQDCPECVRPAPRAFLTAPHLATMDAGRRKAFATNERSASAPTSLKEMKSKHGPGCGCCSGSKSMRYTRRGKDGSKSFPTSRSWMISH